MSNDEYQQQDAWKKHFLLYKGISINDPHPDKHLSEWIEPGSGIEEQIRNSKPYTYNPGSLTEQDIIDFIKALETNENKK